MIAKPAPLTQPTRPPSSPNKHGDNCPRNNHSNPRPNSKRSSIHHSRRYSSTRLNSTRSNSRPNSKCSSIHHSRRYNNTRLNSLGVRKLKLHSANSINHHSLSSRQRPIAPGHKEAGLAEVVRQTRFFTKKSL